MHAGIAGWTDGRTDGPTVRRIPPTSIDRLITRSRYQPPATAAAAWQVLAVLDVEAAEGLPHREAWARLLACGENTLRPEHAPGCFHVFVEELYEGPQVTD